MARKRITIKQVAEAAKVSTQTVSRVMNDRPDVAPETRRIVQNVIDEMGYQPSNTARSLIQGQSYSIVVISYGSSFIGPSLVLQGVQQAAVEQGYSLLLKILPDGNKFDAKQLMQEILSYDVDGILWTVPEMGQNREWIQQEVARLLVPITFLNSQPRPNSLTVVLNNFEGGGLATAHLIEQGRQNIGMVTGPLETWEARQRVTGWKDALRQAGRDIDESFMAEGDWTPGSGERGLRTLMELHPEIDAVFVCSDQMALGALKAAHEMGIRVPEELAIIGYDGIPQSEYFYPALTTIYQDMVALGRAGVDTLVSAIDNPGRGSEESVQIQPTLIVRASTG